MRQFLVDTNPTFRLNVAGTASAGTALISVFRGNGATAVDSGTATDNDDSTYDYLFESNTRLDQLRLEWVVGGQTYTTYEEICGSVLYTVEQARAFKAKADAADSLKPLVSEDSYPDLLIEETRTQVTDRLEVGTGRAWIARYARIEFEGNGSYELDVEDGICRLSDGYRLNRPGRFSDIGFIISATDGGTDVSASLVVGDGVLRRTDAPWTQAETSDPFNIVVEYAYGLPNVVNDADRMGLLMTVDKLVPSQMSDRALTVDTAYGTTRVVQPGGPNNNFSRLPEVNGWVVDNSARAPFG